MQRIFIFLFLMMTCLSPAQDFKFGKVSLEEVSETSHPLEKDAKAAVLFRSVKTSYEYSQNIGFQLLTHVHERVKIYDRDGFDWATKEVSIYKNNSDKEKVSSIKGFTYNIKDGKLISEKLARNGIFEEEVSKYRSTTKFTMPAVTEGSVLEYQYTFVSPFLTSIDDVLLQYTIPINKLEVSVKVPEYFIFKTHFNPRSQLDFPLVETREQSGITTSRSVRSGVRVVSREIETSNVDYVLNVYDIQRENIPSLQEEPHIDHLSNYAAFWKWEILATKFPNSSFENYSETWESVAKSIYTDGGYESELNRTNYFEKELNNLIKEESDPLKKAKKIYDFVKSKVKWNSYSGYLSESGTHKAYKKGEGNAGDINLILTAMLRKAALTAHPVLTSTKNNGVPLFPTRKGFNYVISGLEIQGGILLLDATEENSSFGELPSRTRNWNGRILRNAEDSDWVDLMPSLQSQNTYTLNLQIGEDFKLKGKAINLKNGLYAKSYRDKYKNINVDSYRKNLEQGKGNILISNIETENQEQIGEEIKESYNFELENGLEAINNKIYLKPLLFMAEAENPFKADERTYPVIFNFPSLENKTVNIMVPAGYEVESLPESSIYELNNGAGTFKFLALQNGNFLRVESVLDIKNIVYTPQDYAALKQFYAQLVEKHSEVIVFKKI